MAILPRPILSLWPDRWRIAVLILLVFTFLFFLPFLPIPGVVIGVLVPACWWFSWSGRFCRHVWRFRTVAGPSVVIHSAPELDGQWDIPVLLERCREEHDRLAQQFGFPLRGPFALYLLADPQAVGRIWPQMRGYTGVALVGARAIVLADKGNLQELLRHELAHLFSARWNSFPPPLVNEGLSVWWQETEHGQPIDWWAWPLLTNRRLLLPGLLRRSFYRTSQSHSNYMLAGSFTRFLIRRFGWDCYQQFFRRSNALRFRAWFQKCFGISLEKAEWQWRKKVLAEVVKHGPRETVNLEDVMTGVSCPMRKFLHVVLLVAVRDRLREVCLEPAVPGEVVPLDYPFADKEPPEDWKVPPRQEWAGSRVRGLIEGVHHDMPPVELLTSVIALTVVALARRSIGRQRVKAFLRWLTTPREAWPGPLEGRLQVFLRGRTTEVLVSIQLAGPDSELAEPRVILKLLEPCEAAADAAELLEEYQRRFFPEQERSKEKSSG